MLLVQLTLIHINVSWLKGGRGMQFRCRCYCKPKM